MNTMDLSLSPLTLLEQVDGSSCTFLYELCVELSYRREFNDVSLYFLFFFFYIHYYIDWLTPPIFVTVLTHFCYFVIINNGFASKAIHFRSRFHSSSSFPVYKLFYVRAHPLLLRCTSVCTFAVVCNPYNNLISLHLISFTQYSILSPSPQQLMSRFNPFLSWVVVVVDGDKDL